MFSIKGIVKRINIALSSIEQQSKDLEMLKNQLSLVPNNDDIKGLYSELKSLEITFQKVMPSSNSINMQSENLEAIINTLALDSPAEGANKISIELNNIKSLIMAEIFTHSEKFTSRLEEIEYKLKGVENLNYLSLSDLSTNFKRNILPNNSAVSQKSLIELWKINSPPIIGYDEIINGGFRVFSQNDEDGILLRIFSQIGIANKFVIEIGSNCNGSELGIPENISTNLIVNHGWHGAVFEVEKVECEMMIDFFAKHMSTKHFHWKEDLLNKYYSPLIERCEISATNINKMLKKVNPPIDCDLFVIDIDGGDYRVIEAMTVIQPRVLVVEFEKRFKDGWSVIQKNKNEFSSNWVQSGSTSLDAWVKLLKHQNYSLCAIGTAGFNAFFIKDDAMKGKIKPLISSDAFIHHPILSRQSENFWLTPDDSWDKV